MTDPRAYLSGNGDNPLNKVAEHTLVRLFARTAGPIALAVLGYASVQGYQEMRDINDRLARIETGQAVRAEQIGQHERRITDHDRRLGRLEWSIPRKDGG